MLKNLSQPKKWLPLVVFLLAVPAATASRPNVVFILSDDQGWTDYGFMGHPHLQTPNLDQLARAGLLYERGYVTAPLCRPSLASLATGLYPHQTGIRGNDPVMPKGTSRRTHQELFGRMRQHMTAPFAECTTFFEVLKAQGYLTLQTGKWWEEDPLDHGFTDAMTHGDVRRGGRHGDVGLTIGRSTMKPFYDFVAKAKKRAQPFFVWYGVFLPHAPHNAPDRLYNKYRDIAPVISDRDQIGSRARDASEFESASRAGGKPALRHGSWAVSRSDRNKGLSMSRHIFV